MFERTLGESEVKYLILTPSRKYKHLFPGPRESVTVGDRDESRQAKMADPRSHPRINGLTWWYKKHSPKLGDVVRIDRNNDGSITLVLVRTGTKGGGRMQRDDREGRHGPMNPATSEILCEFDPYASAGLPAVAGVYVLCTDRWRPVYVGKAESIATRVRNHSEKKWFIPQVVKRGLYIEVADGDARGRLESTLIRLLGAQLLFNKQQMEPD